MGIKFDWELEGDATRTPEGDAYQGQQRRTWQRYFWPALLVLVALLGAGTAIYLRLEHVSATLRGQLESTVAAETLALRLGDRSAYLALQAEGGEWRRIQHDAFDEYQALAPRLDIPGEIVEMHVGGDTARVTLRETLDGAPYLVTWHYTHSRHGWLHALPDAGAWGKPGEITSEHFTFTFREADRPFVEAMGQHLDAWWEAACRETGCIAPPPGPRVDVRPDPFAAAGWSGEPADRLIIPSPLLERVPENGPPLSDADAAALGRAVAERWAQALVESAGANRADPPQPGSDLAWMEGELAAWLHHRLDAAAAPESAFFTPLEAEFGADFMREFIQAIHRDGRLVPVLQELTGISAAELPVDWRGYIEYRLRAEAALLRDGYDTEAMLLFQDVEQQAGVPEVIDVPVEKMAGPESIEVREVTRVGDVLLAEVRFIQSPVRGARQVELVGYEPYRLAGDGWVRTEPRLEYWGRELMASSEHFDLAYYELDERAVAGLLPVLEAVYTALAPEPAEGEPAPRYLISVTPLTPRAAFASEPPVYLQDYAGRVATTSPYARLREPGIGIVEQTRAELVWNLTTSLVMSSARLPPQFNNLLAGVAGWQLAELRVNVEALPAPLPDVLEQVSTETLLIRLVAERYGAEAVRAHIPEMAVSADMDDWLRSWLSIADADALRAGLEACLAGQTACPLDY